MRGRITLCCFLKKDSWKFKFGWLFCYLISNFGIKIPPIFEVSRLTSMHWGCPKVFLKTPDCFATNSGKRVQTSCQKKKFFVATNMATICLEGCIKYSVVSHLKPSTELWSLAQQPSKSADKHVMWTWKDTFGVVPLTDWRKIFHAVWHYHIYSVLACSIWHLQSEIFKPQVVMDALSYQMEIFIKSCVSFYTHFPYSYIQIWSI